MGLTLYHYVHCPFCIRVRMALGYLNLEYNSKVLSYDDEITPIALTGKKILPALTFGNETINESLDIIALIDSKKELNVTVLTKEDSYFLLDSLLNKVGALVHSIAMPYWIYTPEFNEKSRNYFKKKKEAKRGPFTELVKKQKQFIQELNPLLQEIENDINPFYHSNEFGLFDILIASHLWGLYIVPEFQFSEKLHQYLQLVKSKCHFNYHQDLWS